jgi:SAM-dependent methyltransferase
MLAGVRQRLRRLGPRFRRYQLADQYLKGLKGIEIGGSANNPFGLDTINVDRYGETDTVWKQSEIELVGEALPVDVVAPGDALPFDNNSWDFVLASHVIEHFPDPVKALLEWKRVARRYVFLMVPHRDRTMDHYREVTPVAEIMERHRTGFDHPGDHHWTVWTCESFLEMCREIGLNVVDSEDPDKKVGNGFAVVIDAG